MVAATFVVAVNRRRFELPTVSPSTTLLEFLRSHTPFKSPKLGCGEGGCGACVVLLSKYDPVLNKVEDFSVNSCLTLLCTVNRCSITTSEGLGNTIDGFHSIHQRFSGFHASQCGFCTPGMCVSLFSALLNAEKTTDRVEPPAGFSKLTVAEAENSIAGNLCRCTGYRPIADACKSFSGEVDIEDLGFNSFWIKGESKEAMVDSLPRYDRDNEVCTFPEFLKDEIRSSSGLDSERYGWYSPATIEELRRLVEANDSGQSMKLVVGNTGAGYYKELECYDRYIDLNFVPELNVVRMDVTGLNVGAVVTIARVIEALKEKARGEHMSRGEVVFERIAKHMDKIASGFIRNTASIGGNLVMAQRKYFPSDIATILLAVDSTVNIMSGSRTEIITLEDFLKRAPLDPTSVFLSIKIPNWEAVTKVSAGSDTVLVFETYRAAPRPLGNALPHLNAAFLAEVSSSKTTSGFTVHHCCLSFGAYGTKHAIRARNVEEFLTGKTLSADVLREAIKLVRATVVPEEDITTSAYRSSLASGFVFDFFSSFIVSDTEISDGFMGNHHCNYEMPPVLSSAKQMLNLSTDYDPVGKPIMKSGAALQASGEAVYVDDIPSPTNCLHGAFIYSTKPLVRVTGINLKTKPRPDGVSVVLSFKDIPKGGENVGAKTLFGTEPLFADDITQCAGQRLAFVVADTQKYADLAANSADVDYEREDMEPPILSVEEAIKRSSFFEVPPFLYPKQVGDISKGMAIADHKITSAQIKLGSQYHFYMETQTALAVPDEDNCIVVYTSSQCPQFSHTVIAKCLGIPESNVRVITRRVGGGFGGKAVKSIPVATACALAAHKLQRPVRIYVNRKTDMIMAGGRHPMKIIYSVGFKSDGKITALQLDILIDAGMSADVSPIMPYNLLGALKKYDWGALAFDVKVCKTNNPSRTAMRGPGEVQGSYIAEAVIEHVASTLSIQVDHVRNINLHTHSSLDLFYADSVGEPVEYTLPFIWDKLAVSSSFNRRTDLVEEFNKCNRWRKRGMSRVPILHQVSVRPTPGKVSILSDGSVVVEVGGIELGQGLWTKVKQMAAFALGSVQCDDSEDLLDKVRVVQSDTVSLIQGGFTAGSTTSESSCQAVRLSCHILVERLTPLKQKLQEQMCSIKWEMLIEQAYLQALNLSASSLYAPDVTSMQYLNYGAAVSEVEVNLLTGETRILQSDIIYDCGQSLNPAVDLGQIEGAFVQGIGFFMLEEYLENSDGLVVSDGTWTYKIPSIDTIPKQFNVEILNSGQHSKRVLSSKASGEPPLLLAVSVHCATRAAIQEARKQLLQWGGLDGSASMFHLAVPATMPVVKELCGLENVESYLEWIASRN
ncbi:indole-3-acetaldehyde oxidase-like [Argentina anserina]|uniref:indole-3-acetaldehyde oxidase-like n=1 Tax=Argentina anserina TaxID=57926 RepID=UPI00217663CD|nr:indole-3-acetaldehyde oxidase-like [Potentilla anserina]